MPSVSASNPPSLPNTCKSCNGCPFGGPRVGGRGNPAASIVFVGEAPGDQELRKGIALTGPSGKVFWDTLPKKLADWGATEQDVYILNALQCRPPRSKNAQKNTQLVEKGAHICQGRLLSEITAHPRKLIVAMGNHALHAITNNWALKITQERGKLVPTPYASIGLLPVVHPAALLRGTGNYRQFRMDIEYAVDLIRGLPQKRPITPEWKVCDNAEDAEAAIDDLLNAPYTANDAETSGFDRVSDRTLCVGIARDPHLVYIFPESQLPCLRRYYRERRGRCIWHNGKFDMSFVRRDCDSRAHVDEDTMLLSYALDESGGIHDLGQVAGDLLGQTDWKYVIKEYLKSAEAKAKAKAEGLEKPNYSHVPRPMLYKYLAYDVSDTLQCFHIMRRRVSEDARLEKLYTKVLIPASELLWWVEKRGIEVCLNRIQNNRRRLTKLLQEADAIVQRAAAPYLDGGGLNVGSPLQLANLLWDRMGMTPPTKGDRSTAKDVLEKLPQNPVIKAIRQYRKAAKALSTYTDSLEKAIRADGAVHTTFKIHGTRTGRLSSGNMKQSKDQYPMQVIPRDLRLRGAFEARKGYVFVKADLNQAELRSLAALSRDPKLVRIYTDPTSPSIHDTVAEKTFPGKYRVCVNKPEKLEMKMIAKNINFGIIYGITPVGLAEQTKRSQTECARWLLDWGEEFPEAKKFIDKCRACPVTGLTMLTPFGRKKRHWIVTRENLHGLQNEAANFPHQSAASDITLTSAIEAAPILRARDCWVVNVVHDEILCEVPDNPETIEWAKSTLIEIMERKPREWGITAVPFKAEADVGKRWGIYRREVKAAI